MPLVSIELGFSRPPSSTDDRSKGYMESWWWEDQSNNGLYKCVSDAIGNAKWIPIDNAPLIEQAPPTTATVGKIGNIIFDTAGKCWMLREIDGSTYSWERLFTDVIKTQSEYEALPIKDANARYLIIGE